VGRTLRRWLPVLVLLVVALVALRPDRTQPVAVPAGELAAARTALASLAVRPADPPDDYERTEFGDGWADADGDGCSTREDVLRRDLTGTTSDGCRVTSGTLLDPYGGTVVAFDRERPTEVQIDHVVALQAAWRTGASAWTAQRRLELANDPLNLLAVAGDLNQEKGAADASQWLPPDPSFRCPYALRQVMVKARYGLWVTAAEHRALERALDGCRGV